MTNKTLNVHGMYFIEGNFGELNGVEALKVDLQDEKDNVTFKSDKVDLKNITEVIEDQGYDVT